MAATTREPNGVAKRYWAEILAGVPLPDDRSWRRRQRAVRVRVRQPAPPRPLR